MKVPVKSYMMITALAVTLTCGKKEATETEAVKFDRVAKTIFKDVYPLLALQVLQDYGIGEGNCLDIGCGPAYWSIEIAKQSRLQIIGIDTDPEAIKIAASNINKAGLHKRIAVEAGDVQHMRFSDGQFDLVVSRGSFPYWEDQVQSFKQIYRVLKPGGIAFIGGGMGRFISKEKKAQIKLALSETGFPKQCKQLITPLLMKENLFKAGITHYTILGDGPGDSGCLCGMWVEIRKHR